MRLRFDECFRHCRRGITYHADVSHVLTQATRFDWLIDPDEQGDRCIQATVISYRQANRIVTRCAVDVADLLSGAGSAIAKAPLITHNGAVAVAGKRG